MKKIVYLFAIIIGIISLSSCGSSKKTVSGHTKDVSQIKSSNDAKTRAYIQRFKEIAKKEMKQYGIPASITLAQGILESASGTSRLAREANNHFGIKCADNWDGEKIYHDDDALNECFRKYKNPEESFVDHSKFLAKRRRYAFLFRLPLTDYEAWAKGLKKAGYATDPSYPSKLIYLIEKYDLHKYDREVLREMKVKTNDVVEEKNDKGEKIIYEVKPGETLYTISKKFGIPVKDIKEMNNLVDFDIYEGQILVLKISEEQATAHEQSLNTPEDNTPIKETQTEIEETKEALDNSQKAVDNTVNETIQNVSQGMDDQVTSKENEKTDIETTASSDKNYITHQVQTGETLYSLSKKYNVHIDEIITANQLEEPVLKVGQTLRIPVKKDEKADNQAVNEEKNQSNIPAYHIVQPGETLYRIHVKYKVPISKLKELNNLKDNTIRVGQKLKLR